MYKYRFDSVLKYRKSTEDFKKNILGQSVKRHMKEKEELNQLNTSYKKSKEVIGQELNKGISIKDMINFEREKDFYKQGIKRQKISVEKAKEDVNKKRNDLVDAMKDRKIMEKLKEKDFEKYKYEEGRKQEKNLDELVSYKTNSKMEGK